MDQVAVSRTWHGSVCSVHLFDSVTGIYQEKTRSNKQTKNALTL